MGRLEKVAEDMRRDCRDSHDLMVHALGRIRAFVDLVQEGEISERDGMTGIAETMAARDIVSAEKSAR